MKEAKPKCSIVVAHTLHDVYNMTRSLQHRGRDVFGFAGISNSRIDVLTCAGQVKDFDMGDLHNIFSPDCHTYFGHSRYATRGGKDKDNLLEDAHPVAIGGVTEKRGNHMIIRDCDIVCVHNGQISDEYLRPIHPEILRTETDTEKLLYLYSQIGEGGILQRVPGAFTMAIADKRKKDIMVIRDRSGIKPGVLGEKDNKIIAASEDLAIIENGGNPIEDIEPGCVYYIRPDGGSFDVKQFVDPKPRFCFFEGNYIANVDSVLQGVSIRELRKRLGRMLAEEFPVPEADVITYLPRCPEPAAREYAKALGMRDKFKPVFYKSRAERSFQGPDAEERKSSIMGNLGLLPGIAEQIRGKKIVLIDDSTIRGNNSRHARYLLHEIVGVKEAYLLNYTPKIGVIGKDGVPRGCEFGVDMPPNDDFVVRTKNQQNRTDRGISRQIGMPTRFLSLDGMLEVYESLGISRDKLCTYCIGGEYPLERTEFVTPTISARNYGK